jgi:hypothetical protein
VPRESEVGAPSPGRNIPGNTSSDGRGSCSLRISYMCVCVYIYIPGNEQEPHGSPMQPAETGDSEKVSVLEGEWGPGA